MLEKNALIAVALAVAVAAGVEFLNSSPALAADSPSSAPTTATAPSTEAMKIFIVEVKGLVQVRTAENQPWKAAKVGMQLNQGAEFRTGPRSSVTCQIPPDQTLVLDRLGTVRIDEAIRSGGKIKTNMIMKYGRTRYDIEAAGAEHESTIRSPSSTLAVRGTSISLYDQPPFTPVAESFHGRVAFRNAQRELRFGGANLTRAAGDRPSVAETALARSVIDPTSSSSRTRSEARYVADQTSKSAFLSFDTLDTSASIPVIRDGLPPPTDAQLLASAPSLPGALDIVLRWQGNANINLEVADLAGKNPVQLLSATGIQTKPSEFLYPGFGLNHGAVSGTIPYDNQGGPNGGMEIAYWNSNYPRGLYSFAAVHISGGPALVTFNTFLNGKPLDNLTTFQVDSTGNLVTDPASGQPTFALIKNSQITRPVNAPTKVPSFFGPASGVASITQFIPSVPKLPPPFLGDNQIPVEPPISFPPPESGKTGKATSSAKTKSADSVAVPVRTLPMEPRPMAEKPANSRQIPRGR